jgi:hypothetical protein
MRDQSFKAEKGSDIRASAAQQRTSGAAFAGVGPTDGGRPPTAPSPRKEAPPVKTEQKTAASPEVPKPPPQQLQSKLLLGPKKKSSSWFSCCRSNDDVAEPSAEAPPPPAAGEPPPESETNDIRGPKEEDRPSAKARSNDDGSPERSGVSAKAKLDETKLVRRDSVLNQKPPTPPTAAARAASGRGSLTGASPRAAPASPSALSNSGGEVVATNGDAKPTVRRLSKGTAASAAPEQERPSTEGGIRRTPSFASPTLPGTAIERKPSAAGSPSFESKNKSSPAFASEGGDMVKQVSLVKRNSSFVMPSARDTGVPPRPVETASQDGAPAQKPGARPSSASGELQKAKKSNIVSGVTGVVGSSPRAPRPAPMEDINLSSPLAPSPNNIRSQDGQGDLSSSQRSAKPPLSSSRPSRE